MAGCPHDQVENLLRMGCVLTPKQLLASATARLCDHADGPTEIGYGGARGCGKSHWMLSQFADDCMRYDGLKCLSLRKIGSSGKEGFEDLLPRVLPGLRYQYVPSANTLHIGNSRVKLGHFKDEKDIDKYLGLEYDVIGVEEATTLSLSKYRAIRSCNRTSKKGWRPRIYAPSNPGGIGHGWYKEKFIEPHSLGKETTTRFIPATVDDIPFVNAEYRAILESFTGWQLRAWRYGDWDIASGQFFTTFSREHHICNPIAEIPQGWRVWISLDYGFVHDTVAYLFAQSNEDIVYIIDEHAASRWTPERHAEAIKSMLARHGVKLHQIEVRLAGGDIFRTESDGDKTANDYAKHGLQLKRANMDRIDGAAEFMRRLGDPSNAVRSLAATIQISESCPMLIGCLPAMVHSPIRPEDVLKVNMDEEGKGGDDAYDAARYGLMHVAIGGGIEVGEDPFGDTRF